MSTNVLTEIARLESELARIQRELDVLKRSVGVPSSRRTQAFAAVSREMDREGGKDAVTREMPASIPPGRPQPSVAVTSEVVSKSKSDRRAQSQRTGLTDYPPGNTPVPPRHTSSPAPNAGRYEFVGEGTSRRRRAER